MPLETRVPGLEDLTAGERTPAEIAIEEAFADTDLRRRIVEDSAIQMEELRIVPPPDELVATLSDAIVAAAKEEGFETSLTVHEEPVLIEVTLHSDRMNVLLFLSPRRSHAGLAGGGRICNLVAYDGRKWYASYDIGRWEAAPQRKRDIETIDRLVALFA